MILRTLQRTEKFPLEEYTFFGEDGKISDLKVNILSFEVKKKGGFENEKKNFSN